MVNSPIALAFLDAVLTNEISHVEDGRRNTELIALESHRLFHAEDLCVVERSPIKPVVSIFLLQKIHCC